MRVVLLLFTHILAFPYVLFLVPSWCYFIHSSLYSPCVLLCLVPCILQELHCHLLTHILPLSPLFVSRSSGVVLLVVAYILVFSFVLLVVPYILLNGVLSFVPLNLLILCDVQHIFPVFYSKLLHVPWCYLVGSHSSPLLSCVLFIVSCLLLELYC